MAFFHQTSCILVTIIQTRYCSAVPMAYGMAQLYTFVHPDSPRILIVVILHALQRCWKAYRKRLVDARRIAHARADGSACIIQTAYYRYRKKVRRQTSKKDIVIAFAT